MAFFNKPRRSESRVSYTSNEEKTDNPQNHKKGEKKNISVLPSKKVPPKEKLKLLNKLGIDPLPSDIYA